MFVLPCNRTPPSVTQFHRVHREENSDRTPCGVDDAKAFFVENVFRRIENVLDGVACDGIATVEYKKAYEIVYSTCTTEFPCGCSGRNAQRLLTNVLKSQVERYAEKYEQGSKNRTLYIKFLCHVFKYLDRFTFKIENYGPLHEWLDEQMERGKPRAAALRRWRVVKSKIVLAERNAKIKARVDLWLIKNGLDDYMDAKSKVPCFRKKARVE